MSSPPTQRFAIYPMVEEGDATGRVAACYGAILESHPFVPSLFKSLAVCPGYLVLAWDQASRALPDDDFRAVADELIATASDGPWRLHDERSRKAMAEFVEPLGRMLVLSAGLLEGLDGGLAGGVASPEPPESSPREPDRPVPSQWEAGADETFGEIRRALGTPMINSIWRQLAGRGLLVGAWRELAPHVEASLAEADGLQQQAIQAARTFDWPVVAGPEALAGADLADAAAGVRSILDAYVKTLPRLLVLAAPNR